ncbi:hypothetical protein ACOSQ3_022834 [Xanthoceras sorbifolium]
MTSNTEAKEKEGQEQDMPDSSSNNHLHVPHPPPDTAILLQFTQSQPSLPFHADGSGPPAVEPPSVVDNETNQLPDAKLGTQASQFPDTNINTEANQVPNAKTDTGAIQVTDSIADTRAIQVTDTKTDTKSDQVSDTNIETEANQVPECRTDVEADAVNALSINSTPKLNAASSVVVSENVNGRELKNEVKKTGLPTPTMNENPSNTRHSFLLDEDYEGSESGTEEEQSAFMKELENFFRESSMEFKPPKFYGEGLNCLKLWRAVTRLGGYDKVTSCKLWRQVGESFKPPKTCTTVSWTFRGFYEKALLDYERHRTSGGELSLTIASHSEPMNINNQASGSGRARRDAAARAMQGWHSQRVLGNGEVSDPIIKDKNSLSLQKREKQLKSLGLLKRKKPPYMEHAIKAQRIKPSNPQVDVAVVDIGQPADWVKITVQRTKDCFEVYALVPGLLREEVRVQSDPAGRLVISGEPENPDNPWGVTPFKKVVTLPARIDPHQTSAVVTLHGQLFVRVPFEPSE